MPYGIDYFYPRVLSYIFAAPLHVGGISKGLVKIKRKRTYGVNENVGASAMAVHGVRTSVPRVSSEVKLLCSHVLRDL